MKKQTYADKARSIMNKYKTRLGEDFDKGDALALEAMNQELSQLRDEQESERAKLEFPMTPDESLPMHVDGGELDRLKTLNAWGFQNKGYLNEGVSKLQMPTLAAKTPGLAGTNNILATDSTAGKTPFKSRVPWMGAVSGIVGNLLMNKKLDLPEYNPETYDPTKLSANLVNYGRSRENIMNERDLADNMILNSARGTGSQNQLMETLLAGKTSTQRTAGQQFNASLENESNTNAQIRNQTDQMNAQLAADAARFNSQNELYSNQVKRENMLMNAERKDAKIKGITDNVTGYFNDRVKAGQYDNMLEMMAPDNYSASSGKDSKWRKLFGISPDMNINLTGTDKFKEKGGYLGDIQLFGDDKYEKLMMRLNKDKNKKNAR